MTTETMNVHQALAELKMLDKRIPSAIQETTWVIANKHSNTKIGGVDLNDCVAEVKSRWQKVNDLIKRRDAIKRAVVISNAVTKIEVAGVTYTVAEAIDRKNTGIEFLSRLMLRVGHDYTMAKNQADRENGSTLETRADSYVKTMVGNTDTKGMTDEIKRMRDEFIKAQTMELVDPIDAAKQIERLNEEITSFNTKVDSALSVSNAVTTITVEY